MFCYMNNSVKAPKEFKELTLTTEMHPLASPWLGPPTDSFMPVLNVSATYTVTH